MDGQRLGVTAVVMPNHHRDSLLKSIAPRWVRDGVIGNGCFGLNNLAFGRFSTPNIDLSLNVLCIGTDEHFQFHVLVPSSLLAATALHSLHQ